jgi:hypothetical protein
MGARLNGGNMFVETQAGTKGRAARWLEDLARRYPRGFTAALIILTVGLTLGLLLTTSPPIVLYQGF